MLTMPGISHATLFHVYMYGTTRGSLPLRLWHPVGVFLMVCIPLLECVGSSTFLVALPPTALADDLG